MKAIKKSICIIIALVSIFALNACGENSESKKEKNEPETYPPAKVMTIKKIFEDYDANALRADDTHLGQRYRCNAQVERVNEEYVAARVWAGHVLLYYNSDQRDFVMNLSEDDVITFEGTFIEGKDFEDVVFKGATKQTDCLLSVKTGNADFAVLDAQLAKSYCGKGDYENLTIVDELSSDVEYYAIGFKKDSELTAKVNAELEKLAEDGTITKLAKKYGVENTAIIDFSSQK